MARKIKFFSELFKNKTDKQLIDEVQELNINIDIAGCFSAKDCILCELIDGELDKRGYDSQNSIEYYKRKKTKLCA